MKKSLFMRYYIPNGISLCAYKCHAGGIHSPDFDVQKEFTKKIEDYVGEERLEDLREKKRTAPKLSTSDLQDILNKWLK
ncbi:hypothetical protein KKF45_04535 [Patescibacteria group bacterium]|nr:hypothetical protein [Patescibacteria group bacterium]